VCHMEESRKSCWVGTVCSFVYLLVSVCLLLGVCGYCYPSLGTWAQSVIAGAEKSPVREAFNTLSDGLEAGVSLRDAAEASFSVLIGHED